jgi:hypothetical protein
MMKLKRVVEAIALGVGAMLAMVTPVNAKETFSVRGDFTASCFTAKLGCRDLVANTQLRIAELREQGLSTQADFLHRKMVDELMEPKWVEVKKNTVLTIGKNDLLDKYFGGSSYTAAWFCLLISSVSYTAISAADTLASHTGWTEAGGTNAPTYTGSRPALTFGTASAGSKATNSASSFTFTGTGTIKGMGAVTNATKDGTTGVLYNAVLFTGGDRAVVNTDVVNVSVTFSA